MRRWERFGCINEINNRSLESHTGSVDPRAAPSRSRFGNKCHIINDCYSVENDATEVACPAATLFHGAVNSDNENFTPESS